MSRSKKLTIVLMVLAVALGVLTALLVAPDKVEQEAPELPPKPEKVTLTIKAVGDNLMHSPVYNSCRDEDGFNFDGLYENIIPYIKDADIAAINQETIFVEETQAFSGYPSFGTPEQVAEQVKERCEIFGKDGGFVFNSIHNLQACTPIKNIVAMLDAFRKF